MYKPSPSSKYLKLLKVTKNPNVLHIYDILINIFPFSELFSSTIVSDFFSFLYSESLGSWGRSDLHCVIKREGQIGIHISDLHCLP